MTFRQTTQGTVYALPVIGLHQRHPRWILVFHQWSSAQTLGQKSSFQVHQLRKPDKVIPSKYIVIFANLKDWDNLWSSSRKKEKKKLLPGCPHWQTHNLKLHFSHLHLTEQACLEPLLTTWKLPREWWPLSPQFIMSSFYKRVWCCSSSVISKSIGFNCHCCNQLSSSLAHSWQSWIRAAFLK